MTNAVFDMLMLDNQVSIPLTECMRLSMQELDRTLAAEGTEPLQFLSWQYGFL